MPEPVRKPKRASAEKQAPAGAEQMLTVRMLVGANAGQLRQVSRAEAVRLCDQWQPQAELVAVSPGGGRETRVAAARSTR